MGLLFYALKNIKSQGCGLYLHPYYAILYELSRTKWNIQQVTMQQKQNNIKKTKKKNKQTNKNKKLWAMNMYK